MSDEQDKLNVNLEPPKLFGRKKKSRRAPAEPAAEPPADPATEPATEATTTSRDAPGDASTSAEGSDPEAGAEDSHPASRAADDTEVVPPHEDDAPGDADTSVLPITGQDEGQNEDVNQDQNQDDEPADPARAAGRRGRSAVERLLALGSRAGAQRDDRTGDQPRDDLDSETAPLVPPLDHYRAAALTGAIIGVGLVLSTWLSRLGCEALRGTASCGTGPGFLLLVALFLVAVMLGSAILKNFQVPDPGSSSFLAVALLAVVALLFLIDALDHWAMLLVVPVLAAGTYLLSVYVTKTVGEQDG